MYKGSKSNTGSFKIHLNHNEQSTERLNTRFHVLKAHTSIHEFFHVETFHFFQINLKTPCILLMM